MIVSKPFPPLPDPFAPRTMSLEESLQAFVIAIEGEREALWEAGDILSGVPRQSLGTFAQAAKCTRARVGQLADLARSFEPGLRDRERSWSWHRAVRQAAGRTQRPIPEVLKEAQEKDYGQRELQALGANRGFVSWAGTCGDCGARVSVRMMAGMNGADIVCPYCSYEIVASAVGGGHCFGLGRLA